MSFFNQFKVSAQNENPNLVERNSVLSEHQLNEKAELFNLVLSQNTTSYERISAVTELLTHFNDYSVLNSNNFRPDQWLLVVAEVSSWAGSDSILKREILSQLKQLSYEEISSMDTRLVATYFNKFPFKDVNQYFLKDSPNYQINLFRQALMSKNFELALELSKVYGFDINALSSRVTNIDLGTNNESNFMTAARLAPSEFIEQLILDHESTIDFNYLNVQGEPALVSVSRNLNLERIQFVLRKTANKNIGPDVLYHSLRFAMWHNVNVDFNELAYLFLGLNKVDYNAKNRNGETLLMQIISDHRMVNLINLDLVKAFVSVQKINLNLADVNRCNVLCMAIKGKNIEVIDFILNHEGLDEDSKKLETFNLPRQRFQVDNNFLIDLIRLEGIRTDSLNDFEKYQIIRSLVEYGSSEDLRSILASDSRLNLEIIDSGDSIYSGYNSIVRTALRRSNAEIIEVLFEREDLFASQLDGSFIQTDNQEVAQILIDQGYKSMFFGYIRDLDLKLSDN